MRDLQNKTAVITGAGSGMGRAMSLRLAEAGMNVVLADVDDDAMAAVAETITGGGGRAIAVHTDVADSTANAELFEAAVAAFERVNVVALNAGVTGSVGRSWTLTEQDWRWSLGILLDGVIHGVRTFVPHLVDHGDGHVVITASIAGHVSSPFSGPYAVAKHGVVALAETLHHDLAAERSSIGVTCLCPGFVNTNIVTAARAREGAEVGTHTDERGDKWLEVSGRFLETGLEPEIVAQQVHDAIIENRFWLFTDSAWDDAIARRNEEIINRRPPTIGRPSP